MALIFVHFILFDFINKNCVFLNSLISSFFI